MKIDEKKLFLFDFDGLLVDTEPLHYEAYLDTLKKEGFPLQLDFTEYCEIAHSKDRALFKKTVERKYPHFPFEWEEIRTKKTIRYRELLKKGRISAMEGAQDLIDALHSKKILTAIVTNSDRCDVEEIARHLGFLNEIDLWITREDYDNPKPSPDGYLLALEKKNTRKEDAIGFEDTEKGISALKNAGVDALLINKTKSANLSSLKELLPINV